MECTAIHWPFSVFLLLERGPCHTFRSDRKIFRAEEGNLGSTFDCSSNFSCSPAVMQFWEMLEIWCKTLRFEGSGNRPSIVLLTWWGQKICVFFVFCWIILYRNIGCFSLYRKVFSIHIIIRLGLQGSSKGDPPSTSMCFYFVKSLLPQTHMWGLIFTEKWHAFFSAAGFVNTWGWWSIVFKSLSYFSIQRKRKGIVVMI